MSCRVLAALPALLMAGCGYAGAKDLPLPGAIGGPDTYPVTVVLDDATNLVVKETCRTNDTIVGSVESITLDASLKARVVCRVKDSTRLPANTVATLRETSLLGERFVALDPPTGVQPRGQLAQGSTLPASSSRTDPNAELVLGALSQVLNGGSLGSIETISRELDTALSGSDFGGTVRSLDNVTGALSDHRTKIASSLAALDRLTAELRRQRSVIADALDSIPGGLEVLDRQRPRLVTLLRRLTQLSRVAVPLIREVHGDTVADLKHLDLVLSELTKAGDELALTLERVATFPFSSNTMSVLKGDYGGFYGTFELDIDSLNTLLSDSGIPIPPAAGEPAGKPAAPAESSAPSPTPRGPALNGLHDLLQGSTPRKPGLDGLLGRLLGGGDS
jgi:phospholipid/cholesterol/gamma-HCH transport system substrate-binding protein